LPEEKIYRRFGIRKCGANRNYFGESGFWLSWRQGCCGYNGNILVGLGLRIVEDFHSGDCPLPKKRKAPGLATNWLFKFGEAVDLMALYATGHTGIPI
jgi:hypothetical protein